MVRLTVPVNISPWSLRLTAISTTRPSEFDSVLLQVLVGFTVEKLLIASAPGIGPAVASQRDAVIIQERILVRSFMGGLWKSLLIHTIDQARFVGRRLILLMSPVDLSIHGLFGNGVASRS